jgi:CMP-N-acetylneuraminic acid synthetase
MDVVALIPARGGSKGIPRKNLVDVGGKPLLAWTVEAAKASRIVTRIAVSTDDEDIAAVAEALAVEVLRRPEELAQDETPMLEVVQHALVELGATDVLVLLQPTSPLRSGKNVDEAVALLVESGADAVLSVVEVPHRFEPGSLMAIRDGRLVRSGDSTPRRQDKPALYARNGPAVLALRPDRLGDDLYGGDCRPYAMAPRESLDVDDEFDLELARLLLTSA